MIKEVYKFKAFVGKHLLDGSQNIVGIKYPQYFKLNMVGGTPIMQYNELLEINVGVLKSGDNGNPEFPKGEPILSPFKTLKKMEYLKKGIKSYINHFSAVMEDGGEDYRLPNIAY